ncbi:hypothetical protein Tco_1058172 [Tanacetum coccineum]|uniref:Uncharacterized protein n=1 Tax=Tanacetum coccineum TaxID=301880 RepID=A0ABQ5H857_9ASTR
MVVSGRIISLPFVVRLPFRVGAEFLIHQVIGQLNSLIQCLGSGRLDVPINVVRKSTDVLVNLLGFVGNKLGTYSVILGNVQVKIKDVQFATFLRLSPCELWLPSPLVEFRKRAWSIIAWMDSGVMLFGLVLSTGVFGPLLVVGAMICLDYKRQNMSANTRPDVHYLSSHISNDSESLYHMCLTSMVTVSDVSGDGSRVHTHGHDGSEATDESLDSILSSEPKPLGKHRPPPPPSILSPGDKLCDPTIDLSHGHRCYLWNCPDGVLPNYPRPLVGLAVELSPISYLEPRVDKHNLLRGGCLDSRMSSLRSTGDGMYRDGGSGGSGGDGNAGYCAPARRSLAEGGDSEIGGDGDGVVMARSLSTSASGGGIWKPEAGRSSTKRYPKELPYFISIVSPVNRIVNRGLPLSLVPRILDLPGTRISNMSRWTQQK